VNIQRRAVGRTKYSLRNSEGYAVIEGGIPIGYVALAPAAPDEQLSIPSLV
jgi:hypothetical protein